jgi:hypothetical protein
VREGAAATNTKDLAELLVGFFEFCAPQLSEWAAGGSGGGQQRRSGRRASAW